MVESLWLKFYISLEMWYIEGSFHLLILHLHIFGDYVLTFAHLKIMFLISSWNSYLYTNDWSYRFIVWEVILTVGLPFHFLTVSLKDKL